MMDRLLGLGFLGLALAGWGLVADSIAVLCFGSAVVLGVSLVHTLGEE